MRMLSLRRHAARAAFVVASLNGCTEPRQADVAKPMPASALVARVELSDSSAAPGEVVVATLRLSGPSVAAATLRLAYDSTGLAFAGEDSLSDGAMRVVNPMPGLVRVAAMAPNGIAGGRVHALKFTVGRTSALRSMKLSVDEAHSASGADLAAQLRAP